jgi:hypothetical protein
MTGPASEVERRWRRIRKASTNHRSWRRKFETRHRSWRRKFETRVRSEGPKRRLRPTDRECGGPDSASALFGIDNDVSNFIDDWLALIALMRDRRQFSDAVRARSAAAFFAF